MDGKELRAWLEGHDGASRAVLAPAISSRAALRVAPVLIRQVIDDDSKLSLLQLQCFRCYLISSLAAKGGSDEIRNAALSASSASSAASVASAALSADSAALSADSAALSALSAADSALSAADSADSADSAARSARSAAAFADSDLWKEVTDDIEFLEDKANGEDFEARAGQLVERRLFHDDPNWSAQDFEAIKTLGRLDEGAFAWWADWLMRIYEGRFRDWALAKKIALLPNEVWEQGAAAVAGEITDFRIAAIEEKTPIVQRVYFDEEKGQFSHEALEFEGDYNFLETLINRVRDAVEDAISGNYLTPHDYEIRIIKRSLERYSHDAQRLEMDFQSAGKSVERRIQNGDLPDAPEVFEFAETLSLAALDIRAHDKEIAKARAERRQQAREEYSEEERTNVEVSIPFFRAIADENFAQMLNDDVELAISVEIPPEMDEGFAHLPQIRADAADRVIASSIKMRKLAREYPSIRGMLDQAVNAIRNTPEFKTLDVVVKIGGGVTLLTTIILWLF